MQSSSTSTVKLYVWAILNEMLGTCVQLSCQDSNAPFDILCALVDYLNILKHLSVVGKLLVLGFGVYVFCFRVVACGIC